MEFQAIYNQDKQMIDQALDRYFSDPNAPYHRLLESMHYSLTAGGKRLRPVLVLAFCRACAITNIEDWLRIFFFVFSIAASAMSRSRISLSEFCV